MSKMIDDYFHIYTEKVKEYGENTVVLHQTGSFYEIYEIDNKEEHVGNAKKLSNILEMNLANKSGNTNCSSRTYPNFIGFTCSILDKYLGILLRNGYTVVIVDQLEASAEKKQKLVKRGITKIYSPSLQPTDYTNDNDFSPNLVSIYFNINQPKAKSTKKNAAFIQTMNVSICCVNNNNNVIEIIEETFSFLPNDTYTLNLALENVSRILYRCNPKELLIGGITPQLLENENAVKVYFNENYENVRFIENEKYDVNYQNKYLREIWDTVSFGLIEPNVYFNLNEFSLTNLVNILKFIEKHDTSYVKNLNIPRISNESNNLVLELNTILQLNIIDGSPTNVSNKKCSLFDVIDYTRTSIGKRHLRNLLCKPFKDPKVINDRYLITEELSLLSDNLDKILDNIVDIEKLHRKMGIAQLHQYEFVKLNDSYKYILELIEIVSKSKLVNLINFETDTLPSRASVLQGTLSQFNEFIEKYTKTFDLSKMNSFNLNSGKDQLENYFNKGIIKELDTIQEQINNLEEKRKELRLTFDKLINPEQKGEYIKLVYTEFEGYSFTCTKIRYQTLLQKLGKKKENSVGRIRQTNNAVKFVPEELEKLSNEIVSFRELLSTKITINYKNILLEYYREYNPIFDKLKDLIEVIDVCNSNLKCSQKFNFVKPEIQLKIDSFIEVDQIRHPLVESLGKEYISNDITLDNTTKGILCYGINSSGKSTLLRAIGVNLIMSQCGLFVAAKSFKFSPFDTLISQVDLSDNIFAGKSSFISEMLGLKRILQCSGKNTLVLMDEATKGTENNSSTALVSSVILELIKSSTKFFFTTHLHDIPNVQDIIDIGQKLKICHLSVDIKNNNIIYERKLKNGPGSSVYGVEVAKSLLECPDLIEKAYEIRNKLIGNDKKIKKSVYNSKKIIEKCEICGSTKQLETDHMQEQYTADEKGFLDDSRHKNHLSNLCTLCHNCHLEKTLGRIKINGYKDSLNGRFLDWEKIEL
jgi:DNA mismatch repair protein MutS